MKIKKSYSEIMNVVRFDFSICISICKLQIRENVSPIFIFAILYFIRQSSMYY